MITIIDENQNYASLLAKCIGRQTKDTCISINTRENSIDQILDRLEHDKPNLILINAETCFQKNASPANQIGIDILKHIRLTESLGDVRTVPILIYSLRNKETLLWSKPENAIILSRGCHFFNIFEFNEAIAEGLIYEDDSYYLSINEQVITLNPLQDLKHLIPYIKLDTKDIILEEHHSIANWWGPHRLLKGYILATHPEQENSYREHPVIKKLENEKKQLKVKKMFFIIAEGEKLSESERAKILNEYKLQGENIQDLLQGKKVLYIDDEADVGWADVLKKILFPNDAFTVVSSNDKSAFLCNDEERFIIYKNFEQAEAEIPNLSKYSIVVLDLRDKRRDANFQQPDNLTGVKLLRKIKNPLTGDPSLPVIIFTASNKQWNYERLLDIGANGYWIKESPELAVDDAYTLRNYLKLRNCIVELLTQESYLRIIWDCIKEFESALRRENKLDTDMLLKKAFITLQYRNINYIYEFNNTYPYLDVIAYIGMAWERYRNARSLKDIISPSIIDYFIFDLRGNFIHGRPTSKHASMEDIVNLFIWFKNLVLYSDKYAKLKRNTDNKHYLDINGAAHYPVRAKEMYHLSTYVTFWNFLKLSGIATSITDIQNIKQQACSLLKTPLGKKEKLILDRNSDLFIAKS